jgi:hypothetical protein
MGNAHLLGARQRPVECADCVLGNRTRSCRRREPVAPAYDQDRLSVPYAEGKAVQEGAKTDHAGTLAHLRG